MDAVGMAAVIPGKFKIQRGGDVPFSGSKHDITAYEGSFSGYMQWLRTRPSMQGSTLNKQHNQRFDDHVFNPNDSQFKGGTFEDLMGPHRDFTQYHKTMNEVQQNKLFKEIATSFDQAMQRKRTRCQYDGDYDIDKRWDAEPFQQRTKSKIQTRIVKINTEAGFSCGVDAKTINEFASFVAAIVTLLERNGILVELRIGYRVTRLSHGHKNDKLPTMGEAVFMVKRADEYLPPAQVLKCLSAVWYRRAVFGILIALADNLGGECDGSLGSCIQWGKIWERKGNELFIYGVPKYDEQHNILKSLTALIGKQEKEK